MSLDLSFAIVPFTEDGILDQLYLPDSEDPKERSDELVEGVRLLGFQRSNRVFPIGLWSNIIIEEKTDGAWSGFLWGGPLSWDSNGRFILLSSRRVKMEKLRERLSALPDRQRGMVETLLGECQNMLAQHGDQLALVID